MQMARILVAAVCAATAALRPAAPAVAQAYPAQPIKLVVPFPAGSATDSIARLIGRDLQETLGQPLVIENKPGAQGIIGAEQDARAAPDGYTLLITAVSFAATESLMKKLPYDVVRDFTPISRIAITPLALLVKPDFPAKSVREFIAHLKARPGKLSAGHGSSSAQVSISQLRAMAGVDVVEVAYKGIPLAMNDVLAGNVEFSFVDLGNSIAQVKGGKLRALAVTSEKRNPLVPDWPAMAETLPGYDIDAWIATIGPRGLPREVAQKLHEATQKALARPDIETRLGTIGFSPAPMGPDRTPAFIKAEVEKWAKLVRQAGIQPE